MSDTGKSKLCPEDVDCGEDHQGLHLAPGLGPCEAVDPNPNFCPASEDNVGMKRSSDSEYMGGDMGELFSSQDTGHFENQSPEETCSLSMLHGGHPLRAIQSSTHQQLHDLFSHSIPNSIPRATLLPQLETVVQSAKKLDDDLSNLMNTIVGDQMGSSSSQPMRHKSAQERESELEQYLSCLERKVSILSIELQIEKSKAEELEKKLKAFDHKEEEERRREEANQSQN